MMSRSATAFALLAILLTAPALAGDQKHQYQQHRDEIAKLVKLTVSEAGLVLDRGSWQAAGGGPQRPQAQAQAQAGGRMQIMIGGARGNASGVDKLFWAVGSAVGAMGRSTSRMNNAKTLSFRGAMSGELRMVGESVKIALREKGGAVYDMDLMDDGAGTLRLVSSHAAGDVVLVIQRPDGVISAALIRGGKASGVHAKSVRELYRKHTEFVEKHLFPMLRSASVGLPPPVLSAEVVAQVCRQLRPSSKKDEAAYKKLLAELDDMDYDRREAATKKLAEQYARFAPMIEQTLKRPPSAEVETRLKDVVTQKAGTEDLEQFVRALGLTADAHYLARALGQTKGGDRKLLVTRLQKLTGEKIGDDPKAWQAWAAGAERE
jgi:hypothetical protein